MALLFADSVDHYATAQRDKKWSTITDTFQTVTATGRTGANAIEGTDGNRQIRINLDPADNVAIVGRGFRVQTSLPSSVATIISVMDGATTQLSVVLKSDGYLEVRRGNQFGTLLATTASAVITTGTWYSVELEATIHGSTGTYDVWVDGVSVLTGTGANTAGSGVAQWTGVIFESTSGGGGATRLDDVYICDGSGSVNNAALGDQVVAMALPDGAGNASDWTPTSGSNYTNVDDAAPDDATSVVSSNTVGHTDLYTFAALGVTGAVAGVQFVAYAKGDQAGVRSIKAVCRVGGTTYEHATTEVLGSDWRYYRWIWEANPATTAPWTVSEIDGAEFGYRVAA